MAQNEASLLIRIKEIGGELLDKLSDNLDHLKDIAVEAGAALVAFAADAIREFKQTEEASNALTQSMVQQGIYTKELKDNYDAMSEALQKTTTYSHDQVTEAEALLQANIGQIPISEALLKATVDLAAAKKMDLATAADMVGKTIGGETNALARQQVVVNQNATETQKLAQVVEQLNQKFGGQASAAAMGLGAINQLTNGMKDFMQSAGSAIAPVIEVAAKELLTLFESITKTSGAFDGLKFVVSNVLIIMNGVISGIVDIVAGVSATLGALAGATDLAMRGQFKAAVTSLKDANDEINKMHADADAAAVDRAKKLSDATISVQEDQHAKELTNLQTSEANKAQVAADRFAQQQMIQIQNATDLKTAQDAIDVADLQSGENHDQQVIQAQLALQDVMLKQATTFGQKAAILRTKQNLQEQLDEQNKNVALAQDRDKFLSQIASMQNAHNSLMAGIGKAAAIAQITINTADAAMSGYKWGTALGGPMLGAAFEGLAIAAGAMQIAKVSGVQMAEGGIVRATPGGIQATIGEGGRDEAVIPLEDGQIPGSGGGNVINFNGPILANEDQAMAFAKVIDRALLKLRQSNQSVAFETDIT